MMKKFIEKVLFGSRWILVPFYIGLIIGLVCYGITYSVSVWEILSHTASLDADFMMIALLEIVDMAMIASLVKMIATGSYHAFTARDHRYEDDKASAGYLKVKMATSLIIVAAIHLLESFIILDLPWEKLNKQLIIFCAFLLGALVLVIIEYIHGKVNHSNDE